MTNSSLWLAAVASMMVLSLGACASSSKASAGKAETGKVSVVIETNKGDIVVELDWVRAPITVANFLEHMDKGDYDNTLIHRVVPGFVIQGGGWTPPPEMKERAKIDEAAGRKDATIKNEWSRADAIKNVRGTIAMAREKEPDSATREFFINLADNVRLDTAREVSGGAGYAAFGRVVKGMEIVDAIAAVPTSARNDLGVEDGSMNNVPNEPVVVRTVRRAR